MEPQVRFCASKDGTRLAYWVLGDGRPYVNMPGIPWSHSQLEWQLPPVRAAYERLGKRYQVIRYDGRGTGVSQRGVGDYSLDAHVHDLRAVVDHLKLEQFALFALTHAAPVAITFAARHPERVSRLVLWCAYARGADYASTPQVQAIRSLMDRDWRVYTETTADAIAGWSDGRAARRFASYLRDSMTADEVQAILSACSEFDAVPLLGQVQAPTLVLHRRDVPWLNFNFAREIGAQIPDARVVILDGKSGIPFAEHATQVLDTIETFLSPGERAHEERAAPATGSVQQ